VLIAQFIEQATAAALDSGCAKILPAVPFAQ
jgi:hypothetical protein